MKKEKKKHKPHGWRETDRLCALCHEYIPLDKGLHRHHLDYEHNITVSLHAFTCHNLVHSRVKYRNEVDKIYGKDFGPIVTAILILKMYKPVIKEALKFIKKVRSSRYAI